MNTIISIYCEGNDTKLAVFLKEKGKIKLLKTGNFDVIQTSIGLEEAISGLRIEGGDLSVDGSLDINSSEDKRITFSSIGQISENLKEYNLKKSLFIPSLTEPSIYYHLVEENKIKGSNNITQEIIKDIKQNQNTYIDEDNLSYIELADKSILSVFLNGEIGCIKLVNSIAHYDNRRFYKIPSVKSAEISLAYYIAKRKKFFPDDSSLLVYIGREYSKLIFLQGRKIKHIGSALDIGTVNLHTYDVYFSKILLEMENGGISSLDNIVVCGEDDSENLILSFYGTFPEANVSKLEFSDIDISALDSKSKEKLSSFSIPISSAVDYFDDLDSLHKGINLLPKYVKEEQKVFQFAWHGFAMLPLLFFAALFITVKILNYNITMKELSAQINKQTFVMRKNQGILDNISELQRKINGFSQTQSILDSASAGAGVWSDVLRKISNFVGQNKNFWLTKLSKADAGDVSIEGYSLSKNSLTEFAYSIKSAELKNIDYQILRDKNVYKFTLSFSLSSYHKDAK